jgi:hypothetical protein
VEGSLQFQLAGSSSLDVLLMRESLGVLPWALQQLTPYARARQASSSSRLTAEVIPPIVQWPLLSTVAASSNSSSSGSTGGVCSCRAPSCHVCTPPAPVTLQQLRLVLEVVCLTCTDTTSAAARAPLLLALLLQRASGDVRAAFLSSADGDRLLVALQQVALQQVAKSAPKDGVESWSWANSSGALAGFDALAGRDSTRPWVLSAHLRAAYTLTWCFLQVDTGAAAAAGEAAGEAAAAATTMAGARVRGGAAWVTPAAVANGCGLYHRDKDWTGE